MCRSSAAFPSGKGSAYEVNASVSESSISGSSSATVRGVADTERIATGPTVAVTVRGVAAIVANTRGAGVRGVADIPDEMQGGTVV